MPGAVSLTGKDTISIDGKVINDLADGDCVKLTFPNDVARGKAAKNGNAIFAEDAQGRMADLELRVLVGSSDDKYLNSRFQEQKNDFSGFLLLTASFSKRVGDAKQNMTTVVYQAAAGVFKKTPEIKTTAEGDVEQSVTVWVIQFAQVSRSIQ